MDRTVNVFADLRFQSDTGIGKVQQAMLDRSPQWAEVVDLRVPGRYGHVLAPSRIASSLRGFQPKAPAVFWSCGFIPPLLSNVPVAVTVHDLTHLEYYGSAKRIYFNSVLRPLYRRCDAIICVSEYTRSKLIDWSGADPDRVHVIYNGIDPSYSRNKNAADMGYRYVLYIGNHHPYKNLTRLIRAYSHSRLFDQNVHLVLNGQCEPDLSLVIGELGLKDYVHFIGFVPESELPAVYRGASAVAYVSLSEGFGLPILEAMASDVPVVTSNLTSMPEVAGNAALIVDPFSVERISIALRQAVLDEALRGSLVRRGRERLLEFGWDESASRFWNLLGRLA